MDDVTKQVLMSVLRSILVAGGSILVAHGYVNDAQWSQLLGAITTGVPVAWGIWDKYSAERKTQARVAEAAAASTPTTIQGTHP